MIIQNVLLLNNLILKIQKVIFIIFKCLILILNLNMKENFNLILINQLILNRIVVTFGNNQSQRLSNKNWLMTHKLIINRIVITFGNKQSHRLSNKNWLMIYSILTKNHKVIYLKLRS